jgi:hypothetical protein
MRHTTGGTRPDDADAAEGAGQAGSRHVENLPAEDSDKRSTPGASTSPREV